MVRRHHRTGRRAALLCVDCAYQYVIWIGGSTRGSCLLLESWLGHSFLSPELRGSAESSSLVSLIRQRWLFVSVCPVIRV